MPALDGRAVELLLIEDDPHAAMFFADRVRHFAPGEFSITRAKTLQAGMDEAADTSFGIAVLSLSLHGKAGIETCSRFNKAHPVVPFIVLASALDAAASIEVLSKTGASAVLVKDDCSPTDLVNALRTVAAGATRRSPSGSQLAAEARFRNAVIDSSDGIVVIYSDGKIEMISGGAEKLFDRPSADLVGSEIGLELLPDKPFRTQLVRRVHACEWPLKSTGSLQRLDQRGLDIRDVEFWPFDHRISGRPVTVCAVRDITGHPADQSANERNVEWLETGLQVAPGIESKCVELLSSLVSLVEIDRFEASIWRPELRRLQIMSALGAPSSGRDRSSLIEQDSAPAGFRSWVTGWSDETVPERVGVSVGSIEKQVFDADLHLVLSQFADLVLEALSTVRKSPVLLPASPVASPATIPELDVSLPGAA